jgi:hypothetical protein
MPSQPHDMASMIASVANVYRRSNRVLPTLATHRLGDLPSTSRTPMNHALTVITATQSGLTVANVGEELTVVAQTDVFFMDHDYQGTFGRMQDIIIRESRRTR